MGFAITEEHQELAAVVRDLAERHEALRQAQVSLDSPDDSAPDIWKALAEPGLFGLHIPVAYGGQGYGLSELAVVVEQLGQFVCPGHYLSTCGASAVIAAVGEDELSRRWLPGLADGSTVGGLGMGPWVLGGGLADVVVLIGPDHVTVATRDDLDVRPHENLDLTRRVAHVSLRPDSRPLVVEGMGRRATAIVRTLVAAEASGLAQAATTMAVEYAKVRQQFGRVIGSFMAVKHHCANMKVQAELATAAAWDAAQAANLGPDESPEAEFAAATAAAVALPAAIFCAETNIQVHGGIGFTWEHPAHLFLRRAGALAALFGPVPAVREHVFRLAASGASRRLALDLPLEAETYRNEVRAFLEELAPLSVADRRVRLVDSGYLVPHWPSPWGRDAGPVEQLVIDEEFERAGVRRPDLGIGGWVTLTFTQHGTPEQVARWTRPSLLGETMWCQLFSEPNAGSDAAGIQTRGTKVDGGWLVNGQKLWTSGAQFCTHGFATVRTDPEAPKHQGITMMAIDLKGPGVTIRPLRSIAGPSGFNEVYFDDVFVPEDDVVGDINAGWTVARATLGNERVSIGSGRSTVRNTDARSLIEVAQRQGPADPGIARDVGALLAEGQAIRMINLRTVSRAVIGVEPSPEGNVTKLLNSEHAQRVAELAMVLSGPTGAVTDADQSPVLQWIGVRGLTIAGGTSEIGRNQIGERLLGLPREPGLR